ncbi:MAG: UDP-N-acetylmuramoyl-L-alanine--D-glutamate ligase [Actinomycetes bacterium]
MAVERRPPIPPGPWLVVGLERSGAACARALWQRGEPVIGVDVGEPEQAEALRHEGIEISTGSDGVEELQRARAVVRSPGVPNEAAVLEAARDAGTPIYSELELGWRMLESPFVAVTGTNGKTTTVELLGEIWRAAGKPVAVAGNVGTAVSSLVGQIGAETTVICEASSFQLEDSVAFRPEVAVLLNIEPDHLDRHGDFESYRRAKLELFAFQDQDDFAVGPEAMLELTGGGAQRVSVSADAQHSAELELRDGLICWKGAALLAASEVRLRGAHNLENALCAAAAALSLGIDGEAVTAALKSFAGVEHRLEELGSSEGVLWVNDSKATNVASAVVALAAFQQPLLLIAGGEAKGQRFGALGEAAAASVRSAFLIGEDADLIAESFDGLVEYSRCESLEVAIAAAAAAAAEGEVVLLSPACASFDQFPGGYQQRGDEFRRIVQSLPGFLSI